MGEVKVGDRVFIKHSEFRCFGIVEELRPQHGGYLVRTEQGNGEESGCLYGWSYGEIELVEPVWEGHRRSAWERLDGV